MENRITITWTEEEVEILKKLRSEGKIQKEIVSILGKTRCAIQTKIAELQIQIVPNLWKDEEIQFVKEKLTEGWTRKKIGKFLGRSEKSVSFICWKNKILKPRKVNEEEIIEKCLFLIKEGKMASEISEQLNVERGTVYGIAKRYNLEIIKKAFQWNADSENKLMELLKLDFTYKEIGSILNCTATTVGVNVRN